jgi:hypothetical protein
MSFVLSAPIKVKAKKFETQSMHSFDIKRGVETWQRKEKAFYGIGQLA